MAERIFTGDSALVEARLMDPEGEGEIPVSAAQFQVLNPFGKPLIGTALPPTPDLGDRFYVSASTGGFNEGDIVEYNGTIWNQVGTGNPPQITDGELAWWAVPPELTIWPGLYKGRVKFTTQDGITSSSLVAFEARDPLDTLATKGINTAVDRAWLKLEDLFDSDLGGPWLQDKTIKAFDKQKLANLLPDALYMINNQFQPVTSFVDDDFPENHYPLVTQALLVEAIDHLVRSYVEQPLVAGGPISYFDRRDYMARWQSVLERELTKLGVLVDMFKMQYTGFGTTAILVGGYNTPITRMSKYWRTRHPRWIGPYVP